MVPAIGQEDTTVVVEMPIRLPESVRVQSEVSMFEQLSLAAFLQRYWADNQVSCTITFDPESEGPHIAQMLQYFQYQLKGVSMFPKQDYSKYPQLPYEAISEATYLEMTKGLKPICFLDRTKVEETKSVRASPFKVTTVKKFEVRRRCFAVRTLSNTVIDLNRRIFWKVLAMPSFVSLSGVFVMTE